LALLAKQDRLDEKPHHRTFELCPLPPAINSAGIKDFGCINKGTRIAQDKTSPGN
jgi:hypothetical protein